MFKYKNVTIYIVITAPKSSSKPSPSGRGVPLFTSYPSAFSLPSTIGLTSTQPLSNNFLFSGGQMMLGGAALGNLVQAASAASQAMKPSTVTKEEIKVCTVKY